MSTATRLAKVAFGIPIGYLACVAIWMGYELTTFRGVCPATWTDIPEHACTLGAFAEQEFWNPLAAYVLAIAFIPWATFWMWLWGTFEVSRLVLRWLSGARGQC